MDLKLIQVNIYAGKYWDALIEFLKTENPDFITAQEVTSGRENRIDDKTADLFELLKRELNLVGAYHKDFDVDGNGHMGNAVLTRHKIASSKAVILKPYRMVTHDEFVSHEFFPTFPRHALDATISVDGRVMHIISTHGAWTAPPQDTDETLRQARLLANYLSLLEEPFLLAGDFNNIPDSKTIGLINAVSNNLMTGSGIKQTTHPKIHKIVPRGYLVDYIFASKDFKLRSIRVPEVTVSDHLPVIAEVEI